MKKRKECQKKKRRKSKKDKSARVHGCLCFFCCAFFPLKRVQKQKQKASQTQIYHKKRHKIKEICIFGRDFLFLSLQKKTAAIVLRPPCSLFSLLKTPQCSLRQHFLFFFSVLREEWLMSVNVSRVGEDGGKREKWKLEGFCGLKNRTHTFPPAMLSSEKRTN